MSEEAPTLNWGDIIRIHGVSLSKQKEKQNPGLIISKGFTDPNIYYQKYEDFNDVNLYRQSLFQILPRSNFDVHDQLQQANLTPHQREQQKSRMINQKTSFQQLLKSKAGQQIKYGSEVIFRHVESQYYLRGILKAADSGEGAFKVDVTEHLSSQLIFRITSHRTYEHENDKIYYNDALQIYHPGADCYMNFAQTEDSIFLDKDLGLKQIPIGHPFYEFSSNRPSIKKPINKRIPIVNENQYKCLWKFIQHCTYTEYTTTSKIKLHDIVYFKHTKGQGLVSSTLAKPIQYYLKEEKESNNQKYGKSQSDSLLNSSKHQSTYYQCFWQLIPQRINELGPEKCPSFWVKNVVTGEVLVYNDFKIQIQPQNCEIDSRGIDNEELINLVCSPPEDGQVLKLERGQTIPLPQNISKVIEYYEQKFNKISFIAVPKMPKDIFKIYKVDEKILLDLQYALSSHEPLVKVIQIFASGLLEIQPVPEDEQQKKKCYAKFFSNLKEEFLINIIDILKMLMGKIFNTVYEEISGSGGLPDRKMQKILVETGIVQLIIEIINLLYKPFCFILSRQQLEDRAIKNKVLEIFEYSYRLLEKVAVSNEQNRMYISRWVDLFLQHSNHINQPYIQQCLVGILQNNDKSIKATINRGKIGELISSFFKEAEKVSSETFLTTKFLRLFSTFIVCESQVIRQNQNIILNDFFKNSNNQQIFKIRIQTKLGFQQEPTDPLSKFKSKQVSIAFGSQQFSTIPKFFRDWTSKWNYFIAYINLLADICLDRNNEAIKNVSALLSLQMVTTILFDPEIQKLNEQIREANRQSISKNEEPKFPVTNVHEPFIRIARNLYINNDKFDPVERIEKICRWHQNDQIEGPITEDINKTKRVFQGEKEEDEKIYLKNILVYIERFLSNSTQNTEDLSMLYTVLDLLKTTIELGLWSSIDEFRKLIPLIVMRITKIDKQKFFEATPEEKQGKTPLQIVAKKKQYLQRNQPEINKSIDCKIKATQIFKQMNEFQIDIRLRYIMNFFKGLYETTEDFNAYDIPIADQLIPGATELDIQRNRKAKQQFSKVEGKFILGQGVKKVSEDQQILLKTNVWYSKLKAMTPFNYDPNVDKASNRYLFQGGVSVKQGEDIKQAMNEHFQIIILSLLQLPVYRNINLLDKSLIMLRSIFQQRKQLVNNFKSILICGKGNLQEVYLTLKFMRNKFQMMKNINIETYEGDEDKNYQYALWKPYDSLTKLQQKRSGVIQDLFFLSRTLKDNISLKNIQSLMRVEEEAFDPYQVNSFIDERQKNNVLFQSLNIAEGIYVPLIEYIKIMKDKKLKPTHFKLLKSIYQYLTLVCFNNLQAKQLMIQYIPFVLQHLKKKVGAANFIHVVVSNNKTLISNQPLVQKIIAASLDACIAPENNTLSQSTLSKFSKSQTIYTKDYEIGQIFAALRGIILFNEQGHHKNQQLLMNKLQDNKYRRLIYKQPIQYKGKIDQFDLSPDQSYIASHFEMFSSLVQSGNLINIGKLENIHPYSYCLESLKGTNRWQIRRALRSYVNRLYYVNKEKDIFLFEQFIRKEFDIINNELNDLILLHKNKAIKIDLVIKNGIRFKYAVSEIMVFIIEILITLHEILLKSEFKKVLFRQLVKQEKYSESSRPLHQKIVRLYRNLGCLNKLYPETKHINSYMREVSGLMKTVLQNFQAKYLEKKAEPQGQMQKLQIDEIGGEPQKKLYVYDYSKSFFRNLTNMIRDIKAKEKLERAREEFKRRVIKGEETEKQMKQRCINSIFQVANEKLQPVHAKKKRKGPMYLNSYLQTTSSRAFKVLAKPQISQNQQNIKLNNQLAMVKKKIQESPEFQKFRDEQHILLVNILSHLDETSSKHYTDEWKKLGESPTPVISMKEIVSIIFKLMIDKPQKIKDKEKIFVIKLIRCYLTEAIEQKQDYKLPVDKWDADYCKQNGSQEGQLAEFPRRQQLIQQCGGSDFIISILSEKDLQNRIDVLNEVLLLGIGYLFGGNEVCQNSILKSLKKDVSNIMLLNVKKLIKHLGDFLINVRANRQSDKRRSFSPIIVDTFNYFSMEDYCMQKQSGHNANDKFQMEVQANNEKAMCRFFRFLQLFCENNNIGMKQFLSTQVNEDNNKKENSVNFIEEACLLLRKFFKIMNNKVVTIPEYLLAFIGEITQLPCLDNQISLLKSTFFEDISYLATYFEDSKNKIQRSFNQVPQKDDDPLNKLLEIYEQGVQLIQSNFEGNDSEIFTEFIIKCKAKYLWIVMRNNIWFLINQSYENSSYLSKEQDISMATRQTFERLNGEAIDDIIENQKKTHKMFEGRTLMILNIITILKRLGDFQNENKKQQLPSFKQDFIAAAIFEYPHIQTFFDKFQQLILNIQVTSFNGQNITNQNIYFPNHPVFNFLSGETRDNIMIEVKRQTRRDKLIDLIKTQENIFSEVQSNYDLNYNSKFNKYGFKVTSSQCERIRWIARNLSYIICVLMVFLVYVDHDTEDLVTTYDFTNVISEWTIRFFCVIQLGLTLFYCYLWGKMRTKLALQKYNKSEEEDAGIFLKPFESAQEKKSSEGWVSIMDALVRFVTAFQFILSAASNYIQKSKVWKNLIEPVIALQQTQTGFNSLALFVAASVMGNVYGVEWFSIHIFDYFANIPLLANVFKSILNNFQKLAMFSLLAAAFILVFNIMSFSTYTPVIYQDDIPEQPCQTILECVLELYTSSAINDDMDTFQPGRFSFDILYVVFMELLFANLIGGIMVDSFSELKEEDKKRDESKKGMCYICCMIPQDMQKNGENFDEHTTKKHFLWNYIFYIYCLKHKDATDYTGIQYKIQSLISNEDISWFPFNGEEDEEQGSGVQKTVRQLDQFIEKTSKKTLQVLDRSILAIRAGIRQD